MNKADKNLERQRCYETGISSETMEFDVDVAKLNGLIDEWLSYLKQNILVS